MNKPASELISLADEMLAFLDRSVMNTWADDFLRRVEKALRTAANQSGSERAGVDACPHPIDMRFGSGGVSSDGSGYSEWRCVKCGHHERIDFPPHATPPAQPAPASGLHPSHVTRSSDASTYDEVCVNCGATDITGGGWGKLTEPCPSEAPSTHGKPDGAVREALLSAQVALSDGAFTGPLINDALKKVSAALHSPKAAETSPGDVAEELGRFGHHPDPVIDFCIEVECLENEWTNLKANFTNGTPPREEIESRVFRAMQFKVGGDIGATDAKAALRKVEQEMRSSAIDRLDVKAEAKSQEPEAVAWFELREPRRVPQRKGPFPQRDIAKTLREFMDARPSAFITVVTVSHAGPEFQDGPECLMMADRRSTPTALKHIKSSAAAFAHPTTKPEAPAVSVDAESIHQLIYKDTHNAIEGLVPDTFLSGELWIATQKAASAIAALIAGNRQ